MSSTFNTVCFFQYGEEQLAGESDIGTPE